MTEFVDFSNTLNPLRANNQYYKFISFDIETYDGNKKFCFGSIYDGSIFKIFWNRNEMIEYFMKGNFTNTYIVATNLGFDFNALFFKTKYYSKFKYILMSGKMIMAKWEYNDTPLIFIDTMNFAGFSVAKMGDILKCPKLDTPVCIGKYPDKNKKAKAYDRNNNIYEVIGMNEVEYYERYNLRDSEISYRFIILIQEGINKLGGKFRFTISSSALDIFRRSYQDRIFIKENASIKNENIDVKKLIFSSYYGGRTEAFSRGLIKNKKLYDINSLYPWAMTQEFPDPSSAEYIESNDNSLLNYFGISNVNITCPKMKYPLLPYRDIKLKKLIFPIGTFTGTYTHVELNKAINLGYKINKINWSIIYKKTFYPFKHYVEDIYAKRQEMKEQESPLEIIYKLFMNSLYGKFGQKDYNEIKFFDMNELSNEDYELIRKADNMTAYEDVAYCTFKKESKSNFIFPIFCSYVTAYGRCRLYDYLVKYNADYCDTDSIITEQILKESKELGEMKLEAEIREGIIVKPKFYRLDLIKRKVFKVKGIRGMNDDMFTKLLNKQKVKYTKFIKMKEAIKHKQIVNAVYEIEKIANLDDNKRIWKKEFNPFIYDNESEPYNLK